MKNIKILLALLIVSQIAIAQENLLSNSFFKENCNIAPNLTPNAINQSNKSINVPTLKKTLNWDNVNFSWLPRDVTKSIYNNNRLEHEYSLSTDLMDTLYRKDYFYDANDSLTLINNYKYNSSSKLYELNWKYYFAYEKNGLRKISTLEEFDLIDSVMIIYQRITEEQNTNGKIIEQKFEYYNQFLKTLDISYHFKHNIIYSPNSKVIVSQIDSTYNSNTKRMEIDSKMVRKFDSFGKIIVSTYYDYINGSEKVIEIDSINYYSNGTPKEILIYKEQNSSAGLEKYGRMTDIQWKGGYYSNLDLLDNEAIFSIKYIPNNQSWKLIGRETVTYIDNFGSKVTLQENYISGTYYPIFRKSYIYDSYYNLIIFLNDTYDPDKAKWITELGNKRIYNYDANGNVLELIAQNYNKSSFSFENKIKYEYSGYISIAQGFTTNKNTLEAKLFPNPSTNGSVNINLKLEQASNLEIVLSDVNGKIIITESIYREKGMNTVKLDGLNKGMFIVTIKSENGIFRSKLLVE